MSFWLGFALGVIFPVLVRVLRRSLDHRRQISGRW